MMTDIQIKLNELILPSDINSKRRGSLYTLNNSLKRNTFYPLTLSKNQDLGYDCKLPRMSLKRKDLAKILEIILSKEEMSLSDRNFLRRILVEYFDEELICSGSRNFINHLKLLQYRSHETVTNLRQRLYYFVLKGAALVKSGGFTYKVTEGETFGHIELLSNENIQSITFTQHTLMVTLNQINFDSYFRYYYQTKYEEKMSYLSCIYEKYLQQVPIINQYFLLSQLQFETFNSGDKIIEVGKPVTRIYFVGNNWKGDMQSNFLDGTFGLKQIIKEKDLYIESAYSLDLGYKVPYLQKDMFVKYVKNYLNASNLKGRSTINTRIMVRNPEADQTIVKLMSMKRVKFQSKTKKKIHTEPVDSIVSDFMFFKPLKQILSTPTKKASLSFSNEIKNNTMFSNRKSQSIQLKTIQKNLF